MPIKVTSEHHFVGGPGTMILGDAAEVSAQLLKTHKGKIQLIYLDPPFGTGEVFSYKSGRKGSVKLTAYTDRMSSAKYLTWMKQILKNCKGLLSETGCIYVHVDYRMSAEIRLMMDQVFGRSNFQNEIIWFYRSGGRSTKHFARKHDTIFFYSKSAKKYFDLAPIGKPRGTDQRNHMRRSVDENGKVVFSIRSAGKLYTYSEDTPIYPSDVWDDIEHLQQKDSERTGYATQKPEALLRRIILSSSKPGDLVADLFNGSGTTAAVCCELERPFIVCDRSPISMHITRARLIKKGSTASLLSGNTDLTIRYPTQKNTRTTFKAIRQPDGSVLVSGPSSDRDLPMVYASAGTISEENCFIPERIDPDPNFPLVFKGCSPSADMIQLTCVNGDHSFIPIK